MITSAPSNDGTADDFRDWEYSVRIRRDQIEVRGIPVEVVRKRIKHVYFTVYPPDGRVRVSAPLRFSDDAVRQAIVSRLAWIRRQRESVQGQDQPSPRDMTTGESHSYLGRSYRLEVIEHDGPPALALLNGTTLELRVRPGTGRDKREAALHRWYRRRLREQIPPLIARWEPRIGVTVTDWGIRKMKTRWGSCNVNARRIWLNLELAKKPPSCLEYIVVHEMVHLLEHRHNGRFHAYLDRFMPDWRRHRDELTRPPSVSGEQLRLDF